MSDKDLVVPDIGDFAEVEVIEVLVKVGDSVEAEQSLITVESDKASMEIPSAAAGKIKALTVKVGDKVAKGSVIGTLEAGGEAAASASPAPKADSPAPAPAPAKAAEGPQAASQPAPAPADEGNASGAGKGSAGPVEVVVPDIGDFAEVEVIELLVAVGDTVAEEGSLITVESDKASMEIPSSAAGKITKLLVKVGDKVAKGSAIAVIEATGGGSAATPAPAQAPAAPAKAAAESAAAPAKAAAPAAGSSPAAPVSAAAASRAHPVPADIRDGALVVRPHASPSVRRFARELGVDLTRVKGSGPKERITLEDVQGFIKSVMSAPAPAAATSKGGAADGAALGLIPWPKVDFAKFGPIEAKPLSRIKKISGANLHRNWVMIPHVTNHEDADITDLEAFRVQLNTENAKSGMKLTMLAFLIKACVVCLKKIPEFNASLDGDNLVYKQYYHIGFAADTPNGLVVPVVKDADRKGIAEIAAETAELAKKARDGKLAPADMQGGTFSISSLGGIGGTSFTPIINAPEVAILGVCRSSKKPVWNDDKEQFEPRLILPLSLSFDHRVIDGAAAARFNALLAQLLRDFRRVML